MLVPLLTVAVGCFGQEDYKQTFPRGAGGPAGTGGSSAGVGGDLAGGTGATSGTAGIAGSAGDLSAGTAGLGGSAGDAGSGASGAGVGGVAGSAGDTAAAAGTSGSAGDATGGSAGSAGVGGAAGATGGAGSGGGPSSCAAINPQAQANAGHCYYMNTGGVIWSNARQACMALSNGHLVTITSQAEQDFVWGLTGMVDTWIGCTDGKMDNEGGDGTPSTWITGEDIAQFNGWADGEPNNYMKTCPSGSGDCYEHCGFMQMSSNGAWNDDICGGTKPYVCEWDSGG